MEDDLRVRTMIAISTTKSINYADKDTMVSLEIEPLDYLEIDCESFNYVSFIMEDSEYTHRILLKYEEIEKMAYGLLEMVRIRSQLRKNNSLM